MKSANAHVLSHTKHAQSIRKSHLLLKFPGKRDETHKVLEEKLCFLKVTLKFQRNEAQKCINASFYQ